MIGGRAGYGRFLEEGLKEGHREEYYRVEDQRLLGGEGFKKIWPQRLKTGLSYGVQNTEHCQCGIVPGRGKNRSYDGKSL
jgi:hypothetical protein